MKAVLNKFGASIRSFVKNEDGVVMVEWVALAGIFVAVLITLFISIGSSANTIVTKVDTNLRNNFV